MSFHEQKILGRTGLKVGRLGVASSYGAPAEAYEEAFDRGVNYFYWGAIRKEGMRRAIRNIVSRGQRDALVIVLQSYSRSAGLMERYFYKGLKDLGIDRAEVLLLGWHNKPPSGRIVEKVLTMRERGMFRFLAVSGHNRKLFPVLAEDGRFDICHLRYNAVHRGAEEEVFSKIRTESRPGLVSFTATRWGDLLNPKRMPPGEQPPRAADCYRFVMTHPMVDVCMSGPKNQEEMREALAALQLGPLSEEEMDRMKRIGAYIYTNHKRLFAR
jgi:aryl-alcohol dehydrogenase-like predicted oxidoreductase